MKHLVLLFPLCALCAPGCDDANRSSAPAYSPETAPEYSAAPDNTAINERDRQDHVKTPINQNENQRDVNLTADIRKRVVDTQMSIAAQNVKIITQDGKVTLRGPVKSADEKTRIEEIANDVAGADNVDSQLEVAGDE